MNKLKRKPPPPRPPVPIGGWVMGMDVSSSAAGLALATRRESGVHVLRAGLVKPPSGWDLLRRLAYIGDGCADFAAGLRTPPLAVLEWATGARWGGRNKGRKEAWSYDVVPLAAAQGVALEAIRPNVSAVETVSSAEWSNRVSKEARAAEARRCWAYAGFASRDVKFDVADAIGICLWRMDR